jgi:hypothetical protein
MPSDRRSPHAERRDLRFSLASPVELGTITTEVFAVRLLDGVNYDGAPAVRYHDGEHLL